MIRIPFVAVLLVASGVFVACQSIPKAPTDAPRVEIEVAVEIEDAVRASLGDADAGFQGLVEDVVMGQADVGLRFYPVASARYDSGQSRPPYLMTVKLDELMARAHKVIADQSSGRMDTVLDSVTARVTTSIERRRDNAPALLVGTAAGDHSGRPRAGEADPDAAVIELRNVAREVVSVPQADLRNAIERALRASLKELVRAIDREAVLRAPATSATAGR